MSLPRTLLVLAGLAGLLACPMTAPPRNQRMNLRVTVGLVPGSGSPLHYPGRFAGPPVSGTLSAARWLCRGEDLGMTVLAVGGVRLATNAADFVALGAYFLVVLGIGFAARRSVSSSLDFFLSGRALPAWVTGLAFISANLGAIELLGMSANGAQYGIPTMHYYWVGAIPA